MNKRDTGKTHCVSYNHIEQLSLLQCFPDVLGFDSHNSHPIWSSCVPICLKEGPKFYLGWEKLLYIFVYMVLKKGLMLNFHHHFNFLEKMFPENSKLPLSLNV